jgi:hypothetical protein
MDHKLMYLATLQNPDISFARFYFALSSLEEQRLAEHQVVPKIIDGVLINEYQYKKLPGGHKVEVKKISSLELIFQPRPSFNF